MGQNPDEIRQQIARTRTEMGDTVDAIGHKADVPARVKEKVSGAAARVKQTVAGTASQVGDRVSDASRGRGRAKHAARRAGELAQDNPLGLAVGAVALGFLAGLATPPTRVEHQRLGRVADQVKDRVRETGQDALQQGKDVVQQAARRAAETVKEQGQEQGHAVTERAKDRVRDIRP